jgi:hypothetical protein
MSASTGAEHRLHHVPLAAAGLVDDRGPRGAAASAVPSVERLSKT